MWITFIFKVVFLDSFQYSIIVFISKVYPKPSGSQCAAHFVVACTFLSEADVGIGCKVMDNMENKTVLCDVIPMSCHVVNGLNQHVIINGR